MVSVLMTCFNSEQFLPSAIESVLLSTYSNFELLIVDDCSADNSFRIAQEFEERDKRVKAYQNEKNLSDYQNRNKAASLAAGKYIKYLDSDDIMYRHCLEVMVNAMETYPHAGFGLSAIGDKKVPYPVCISPREIYLEHYNGYGHFNRSPGSAIINRTVFNLIGGFTGKRHIGDTELWYRLAQDHNMVKFPPDLYWARTHANSESAVERKSNFEKIRMAMEKDYLNSPKCPISVDEIKLSLGKRITKKFKL